jgi:hypothetical protein
MNFQTLAESYLLEMGYKHNLFQPFTKSIAVHLDDTFIYIGPNWIEVRRDHKQIASFTTRQELDEAQLIYLFHALDVVDISKFMNEAAKGQGISDKRAIWHVRQAVNHLAQQPKS